MYSRTNSYQGIHEFILGGLTNSFPRIIVNSMCPSSNICEKSTLQCSVNDLRVVSLLNVL